MTKQTFTEYLENIFADQCTCTKDKYEEALDRWFAELDVQEVIDYAEEWGKTK